MVATYPAVSSKSAGWAERFLARETSSTVRKLAQFLNQATPFAVIAERLATAQPLWMAVQSQRTHIRSIALQERGNILLAQQVYARALMCFDQAIALDLSASDAWYGRGDALANLYRYPEALASFDRVISLNPNHAAAWTFRAVMLIHLERYPEALESCNRALEILPQDAEAWTIRGAALQRMGRYKAAYSSYDRALGAEKKSLWHQFSGWVGTFIAPGQS